MAATNETLDAKSSNQNSGGIKHEDVSFDTAMDLTGVGKFNIGILLLSQFILVGVMFETLGFSYVLPASQCDLDLSMTERGWIATIPFMTVIVSSNLWGWFADTYGRKRAIFTSTAIGSTLSIISSFMPELISFALLRLLNGLFVSGCSSLVFTFLGEMAPGRIRDKFMLLGNTALALGSGCAPLISWGILPLDFRWSLPLFGYDFRPWRLLICCFALPCAISVFIMLTIPETPKFLYGKGRYDEAIAVLKQIYKINTGRKGSEYAVSSLEVNGSTGDGKHSENVWSATAKLFTPPLLRNTLLFSILQFTVMGTNNGFYMWMPDVINRVVSNPSVQSENMCSIINSVANESQTEGWIFSNNTKIMDLEICDDKLNTEAFTYSIAIGFVVTAFTIISAFGLRIIGKRMQLTVILALIGAFGLSINWIYNSIISLAFLFSYQFMGTCIGLGNAFVVESYPTNIRATAVAFANMTGRLGSVVCTNLIGVLINVSCPTTFYLFSALIFAVAISTLFFPNDVKNKKNSTEGE